MQRGKELYGRIRPQVEEGNRGKVLAIDPSNRPAIDSLKALGAAP